MKVLIGYDGTETSKAGLRDLEYAGLPDDTQVLIVSVAGAWENAADETQAVLYAGEAREVLRQNHPSWVTSIKTMSGSPAAEILVAADHFMPDMIVVGESTPDMSGRSFFLGQNTQRLLTDADCTVRIGRDCPHSGEGLRLLVGVDGSRTSLGAVAAISERTWAPGTEIRMLVVVDSAVINSLSRFAPQVVTGGVFEEKLVRQWADSLAAPCLARLAKAGLQADIKVRFGNPKVILPEEAGGWNADALFVGPHGLPNSFARFLVGSVSSAVAARADRSVEVVRTTLSC